MPPHNSTRANDVDAAASQTAEESLKNHPNLKSVTVIPHAPRFDHKFLDITDTNDFKREKIVKTFSNIFVK